MKVNSFQDLEVWQLGTEAALQVYKLTKSTKFRRDFSLCDQMHRAVISISSNIVEGFERNNNNEFIYFLRIAKGSTGEVRSQLYISMKLEYITQNEYELASEKLTLISNKIGRLITYLSVKKKNHEFSTR